MTLYGKTNFSGASILLAEAGKDDVILLIDSTFNPVGAHVADPDVSSAYAPVRPNGATKVLVQCFTQNVRFTLDGTTPTASTGFQIVAGDPPITIPIGDDTSLQFIEEAATASLQLQWGY